MIPDFLLLKVVYLRSLFWMYCISILTRPRVFFPGAGFGLSSSAGAFLSCGECTESLSLTLERSLSCVEVVCVVVFIWNGGRGYGVEDSLVWGLEGLNLLSPSIVGFVVEV